MSLKQLSDFCFEHDTWVNEYSIVEYVEFDENGINVWYDTIPWETVYEIHKKLFNKDLGTL